jgi:hypothetical protein
MTAIRKLTKACVPARLPCIAIGASLHRERSLKLCHPEIFEAYAAGGYAEKAMAWLANPVAGSIFG